MPSTADLAIYQGDDFRAVLDVYSPDGTPTDLTGYVVLAQLRRGPADDVPEVAQEITCTITGSSILLEISHDDTVQLSGQYVWDLDVTAPDGLVTTLVRGSAVITPEVSRIVTPVGVRKRKEYAGGR